MDVEVPPEFGVARRGKRQEREMNDEQSLSHRVPS